MQRDPNQTYSYFDQCQYRIIEEIDTGYHSIVKKAIDKNGKIVAIKIYKPQTADIDILKQQLTILKSFKDKHIVEVIDSKQSAKYINRQGDVFQCFAIVLEYINDGKLQSYIANGGGRFPQKIVRTFFNQIMNGLSVIHDKGYAHRDIKLSNILLKDGYLIKITDFGFSCPLQGKQKNGLLKSNLGTKAYKAPQISFGKGYNGVLVDIFAAGVLLFIMYTGKPPFPEGSHQKDYQNIKIKKYQQFWHKLSLKIQPTILTKQFKDLFIGMVNFNCNQRYTLNKIFQHPWVKGQLCKKQQIKSQIADRKVKIEKQRKVAKEKGEEKKIKRMKNVTENQNNRDDGQTELTFYKNYIKQKISKRILSQKIANSYGLILKEDINYVIASLKTFLTKNSIKFITCQQDYQLDQNTISVLKSSNCQQIFDQNKIIVQYQYYEDQLNQKPWDEIKIQIQISIDPQKNVNINFQNLQGNNLFYLKIIQEIKKEFIYCLVEYKFQESISLF